MIDATGGEEPTIEWQRKLPVGSGTALDLL